MGIVSLSIDQWAYPKIDVGNSGQLSKSSRQAHRVGNFKGHSLRYLGLDYHYAKYRCLPMLGWNKQTRVMNMTIQNTSGFSFAELNKQDVKLAIKQAWDKHAWEACGLRDVHKNVRVLRNSELERLAPKLLLAMKHGFGVHKVTQQVSALAGC